MNKSNDNILTDIDGNFYKTVKIGNQIWMAENLNVSRFRDGRIITEVRSYREWKRAGDYENPAWCYYKNKISNGRIYGKLYNWYAAIDPRGLAPYGWHVPSHTEWSSLGASLGGDYVAGSKLKAIDTSYWKSPNEDATNKSEFCALPGGLGYSDGRFVQVGEKAIFWSTTESNSKEAWYRSLNNGLNTLYENTNNKSFCFSIRCLKD